MNSRRRSGSSGRSKSRKRVVITAQETVRVRDQLKDGKTAKSSKRTARSTGAVRGRAVPAQGRSTQGGVLAGSKKHEREKRQQAIRFRRVGYGILVAVMIGAAAWGVRALYLAPVLRVESVSVSGEAHLTREQVLATAEIPTDATMLRLGGGAIERRLEADPWIISARVERDFPHGLKIKIEERKPAILVDLGGTNVWLASADGHWLGGIGSTDASSVVPIRGVDGVKPQVGSGIENEVVLNAIAIATGISEELRSQVREIVAPSIEKTALITLNDVEVFVGDAEDIETKDRIAREILEQQKGRVVYINVRVIESPTWRGLGDPGK